MRATVKGQRVYLANRQAGISAIMEFARQQDRDLMARGYDDHMKTTALLERAEPPEVKNIEVSRPAAAAGETTLAAVSSRALGLLVSSISLDLRSRASTWIGRYSTRLPQACNSRTPGHDAADF
jgi:hypothetical protein